MMYSRHPQCTRIWIYSSTPTGVSINAINWNWNSKLINGKIYKICLGKWGYPTMYYAMYPTIPKSVDLLCMNVILHLIYHNNHLISKL